ncbi:hypothetical protein KDL01_10125 [Actinospica durhamensis]|uniref:Uncharacterized protein n=1 Tax=Actinospica durhamensis TaxID=1508375 RepID=A0A941IPY6_9ACTN|nr:hypothetical protein [Actinospica durhamensis]MBR7833622.1 hypothetical protein [Actinospica durhamensis]
MTLFPHTRLHLPDPHPNVTAVSELPTAHGLVWVASVELQRLHVGTFENDGNGAATEFVPYDTSVYGEHEFEAFAAACLRDGAPVSAERVIELLVEEYDTALMVREVSGHTGTYVRQVRGGRTVGYSEAENRPVTRAGRLELARQLAPRPIHGRDAITWEMWTGERWQPLPIPLYD